jgi:hypothetical protein
MTRRYAPIAVVDSATAARPPPICASWIISRDSIRLRADYALRYRGI